MKYIRTLTILTDAEIRQNEIPLFRGAVIQSLGEHPKLIAVTSNTPISQ